MFPHVPVDYGYRDSKYFWYSRSKKPIAEPIPSSKGLSLDTVKYAASRIDDKVKFTMEYLLIYVLIARIFYLYLVYIVYYLKINDFL